MKKRILVTGSNGQLGKSLYAISHKYDFDFHFVTREELDITDKKAVNTLVESGNYSAIINAAAYTAVDLAEKDADQCYKVNDLAVSHLAEACASLAQNNPIFIHVSSDYVYHPMHNNPMDENEPTNPQSIYAKSKLQGELQAANYENSIIIRTSWVYAKEGKNFVNTMKKLTAERTELSVVNNQIGSPTYAIDLAEVIMKCIETSSEKNIAGTYNFCNSGYISWYDFAEKINEIEQNTCIIAGIPTVQYPTPAKRPLNSRLITSKIQETLDVTIRSWDDALYECLKK